MKILVINPNISDSVSQLIGDEARRAASPGTAITMLTARFGVAYIETRFEALIGAYAAAELAAEHWAGHDAVIVAAFGDPGVPGIREALDIPVVGLTEAALASACLLGHRFSIVAISRRITAWYRESRRTQRPHRPPRERPVARPAAQGHRRGCRKTTPTQLRALCTAVVEEDGADVIILGGAPLAGLARTIKGEIPVPVVDGVSSAVRHAETLARLEPGIARAGSFAPPPVKPNAGLSAPMQALLRRSGKK